MEMIGQRIGELLTRTEKKDEDLQRLERNRRATDQHLNELESPSGNILGKSEDIKFSSSTSANNLLEEIRKLKRQACELETGIHEINDVTEELQKRSANLCADSDPGIPKHDITYPASNTPYSFPVYRTPENNCEEVTTYKSYLNVHVNEDGGLEKNRLTEFTESTDPLSRPVARLNDLVSVHNDLQTQIENLVSRFERLDASSSSCHECIISQMVHKVTRGDTQTLYGDLSDGRGRPLPCVHTSNQDLCKSDSSLRGDKTADGESVTGLRPQIQQRHQSVETQTSDSDFPMAQQMALSGSVVTSAPPTTKDTKPIMCEAEVQCGIVCQSIPDMTSIPQSKEKIKKKRRTIKQIFKSVFSRKRRSKRATVH